MKKVGLISDIHIRVDDLPVILSWNNNRLTELAISIQKQDLEELWIIGDLFDRAKPNLGDIIAAKHFVTKVGIPIKYLEGNHERINKDIYTLGLLEDVLGIQVLPEGFEIEDIGVTAISHRDIQKIETLPPSDLLLSHFRWSHDVFGDGELSKKAESIISETFQLTILGDIHYPYEPKANVKYISSPYSINFGAKKDYGMVILEFNNGELKFTRELLDLPCKISSTQPLSLVNGYVESTDSKHMYRLKVDLKLNDYEKFKNLRVPNNIELIPNIIVNEHRRVASEKLDISTNIQEVLMGTLKMRKEDKTYIKEVIKEK